MKLPDFKDDAGLNRLRDTMGAPLVEFTSAFSHERLTPGEIERLAREGIEIPLDDVQILDDGTLGYKSQRVVLYIRDVTQYRSHALKDDVLPRFHVAHCDKLQEMRANNRFGRYVVSTRQDGTFVINLKTATEAKHRKSDERLRICQFCLSKLNWDDFAIRRNSKPSRIKIVSEFTLDGFFGRYGKTFVSEEPDHDDKSAPLNEYSPEFARIASEIKRAKGFRCDKCRIDLSGYRRFLHAHHKNGLKSDNRETNIAILCIEDHANETYHGHMKGDPNLMEFKRLKATGVFGV